MAQIQLNHVCKRFAVAERPPGRYGALRGAFTRTTRRIDALRDISFTISEGELVGYIGPNGAGKSTTVKVMSGILTPEEGECTILGRVPWKRRVAHVSQIGVVFGQRSQLWWDVPVMDSFELLRDIYGISQADYQERLRALDGALGIGEHLKTPVRQLSLGQRMRCEIAAALLHRPRILFLDEPTIGLDAVSKLALREFLKQENRASGVTMILTTHDMDDIESLCDRVMTIGHGRLLFDGTLTALKQRYAPLRQVRATLLEAPERVEIAGAQRVEVEGRVVQAWFDARQCPAHEMVAALAGRYRLTDVVVQEQDIDEIIAAMYREMAL